MTKDGSVRKYRAGKLGWNNVLVADQVFTDSRKGNVAKSNDLRKVFGTDDLNTCLQKIVQEGDLQVSAKERREDQQQHRRAVIGYMHRTYVDARNLPHPVSRLEGVIDEAKVRLDQRESVEKQADEIVKKLQGTLVFRKNTAEYTVVVKHEYAKKVQSTIYQFSDVRKEDWSAQGCTWTLNVSPHDLDNLISALNKTTKGDFQLLIDGQKPVVDQAEVADSNRKKKKEKRARNRERREKNKNQTKSRKGKNQ
jgi:ribosome maturation protein SDO1